MFAVLFGWHVTNAYKLPPTVLSLFLPKGGQTELCESSLKYGGKKEEKKVTDAVTLYHTLTFPDAQTQG